MIKNLLRKEIQQVKAFPSHIKWYFSRRKHESIYFLTFHKCASSLFGRYVLKNINGLCHVDYENEIYSGKNYQKIKFEERGYIYGPIRLSSNNPKSVVYKRLVMPISKPDFIRDKRVIFLIRDPRDILVSAYYSSGYSHRFSPVKNIREEQKLQRNKVLEKTLDEYVLDCANGVFKNFQKVIDLERVCECSIILKYEDMINDFEYFIAQLSKYVDIDERVIQEVYKRSRPKKKENILSHRRSGKPGGFRSKLSEQTIASLNRKFEDVLVRFQYSI